MHWLLLGCSVLAMVTLSVSLNHTLTISQKPRFYGVKTHRSVVIHCVVRGLNPSHTPSSTQTRVSWFHGRDPDMPPTRRTRVLSAERVILTERSPSRNASITLTQLELKDSGIYYCRMNKIWGPGTEVQVFKPVNVAKAEFRGKMKDGLILLQVALFVLGVAAPLLRLHTLRNKQEAIYEVPQHDHIYEGLVVETCSGGVYHEISASARSQAADASWEKN